MKWPNHALQRTAPCVTARASAAAFPPTMQVPRRTPRSLSFGQVWDGVPQPAESIKIDIGQRFTRQFAFQSQLTPDEEQAANRIEVQIPTIQPNSPQYKELEKAAQQERQQNNKFTIGNYVLTAHLYGVEGRELAKTSRTFTLCDYHLTVLQQQASNFLQRQPAGQLSPQSVVTVVMKP
jgi:hypothetical protein